MTRTSRARRQLHVVEPSPAPHEPQEPSSPTPASDSEVPQPDSGKFRVNSEYGDADPDLDAALTGMSLLLHLALRLMKSHDASPTRRDRGR